MTRVSLVVIKLAGIVIEAANYVIEPRKKWRLNQQATRKMVIEQNLKGWRSAMS